MPASHRFTNLQEAVLIAVSYGDVFDFAPKVAELGIYLPMVAALPEELNRALDRLVAGAHLVRVPDPDGDPNADLVHLPGRDANAHKRRERMTVSAARWKQIQRRLPGLLQAPWIKGCMITGSLAADNADARADVDLFLILDHSRMWLAYLLVRLWTKRFSKVEFCPNYCVADDCPNLLYPNLFTAIEWAMAVPVKSGPALTAMERKNQWYRDYLPNAPKPEAKRVVLPERRSWAMDLLSAFIASPLGGLLNRLEFRRLRARTGGLYQRGDSIYKPHPPTRQYHIFNELLGRMDQLELRADAVREHIAEQIVLLKHDIDHWQVPAGTLQGASGMQQLRQSR